MRRNEIFLLDTQACIAWAGEKVPAKTLRILANAAGRVHYTELAPWEMMIKRNFRLNKFTYDMFWRLVEETGWQALPLSRADLDQYHAMPFHQNHSDPFDRMIIAQALRTGYTLVGSDEYFSLYKGLNILWE